MWRGMVEKEEGWIWEGDILIEKAILGLAKGLALEGFPGVHGDDPS